MNKLSSKAALVLASDWASVAYDALAYLVLASWSVWAILLWAYVMSLV